MKKPSPVQTPDESSFELRNNRAEIDRAETALIDAVARHGYPQSSVFAVRLAFEEAVLNALRHGHSALPDRPVRVRWRVEPQRVVIHIADEGPGFNPDALADPTLEENLEKPSGRGIMLMRAYMSEVVFNESGNEVEMVYRRPPDPPRAPGA